MPLNVEFKARCEKPDFVRSLLLNQQGTVYHGRDHQVDVYFNSPQGRLKLRKGTIENNLIFYERENKSGPKQSDVALFRTTSSDDLEDVLTRSMGVKVIVDKMRDIHFIDNVKFHVDSVVNLGSFVEVEAIDTTAAGDTFNGALAVALSEGKTLSESVTFANKAASLSVTKIGAQASVPFRKELMI